MWSQITSENLITINYISENKKMAKIQIKLEFRSPMFYIFVLPLRLGASANHLC